MPTNTFAAKLVGLREAADISQYELAKRAGLSRQALSLLEMGEREPNWATVQRLAAALGVDCNDFTDPGLALPAKEGPARARGRPPKATPGTPPAEDLEATEKQPRGRDSVQRPFQESKGKKPRARPRKK